MAGGAARKVTLISLFSFLTSLFLFVSGLPAQFELKAYDILSRSLNPPAVSDSIIIVAIDQQSLDALAGQDISWPWPRQVYAPIIEYLSEAEAVFMDILFTEQSSYGMEDDRIFADAVRMAGNVHLPLFLTDTKSGLNDHERQLAEKIALREMVRPFRTYNSMIAPVQPLASAAVGAGNVMIKPDPDGTYRKVPLVSRSGQYALPHFVLSHLLNKKALVIRNSSLHTRDGRILHTDEGMLIRYSSHPSPFRTISASDIIKSFLDSASGREPGLEKDYFRGKQVFIGLTAPGLYDLKPTATAAVATGVHIHAATLYNLMTGSFIRPLGNSILLLFMFLLCVSVTAAVLRYHSLTVSAVVFPAAILAALAVPAALFRNTLYLQVIPPLISAVLSFAIAAAYSYAVEGRQRRFIKKTFSQYMDRTLVEYVLKNPELIQPGGHKKRITVFFADIAGFTALSEQVAPEEAAMVLHRIFNAFTEVIIKNRGVIDKYIGDCVMAFWGAPVSAGQDEAAACHAAIQCMEALQDLNRSFASKKFPEISMRIGIHTGDAIVGNLGSDRLFDYTVVGDTVNLASRLESINKVFRTKIIVSEETMLKAGDDFLFRGLGRIAVKGRSQAVKVLELAGIKEKDTAKQKTIALFHEGLDNFMKGEWEKAEAVFDNILIQERGDGPAAFYKDRCSILRNSGRPLTDGWDIITMTEK